MKMYSAPDVAFMGKRPVRSECAVCDSGITLPCMGVIVFEKYSLSAFVLSRRHKLLWHV